MLLFPIHHHSRELNQSLLQSQGDLGKQETNFNRSKKKFSQEEKKSIDIYVFFGLKKEKFFGEIFVYVLSNTIMKEIAILGKNCIEVLLQNFLLFLWGQGVWVFFINFLGLGVSKGILIVENGQEGKGRDTVKKQVVVLFFDAFGLAKRRRRLTCFVWWGFAKASRGAIWSPK